MQKVRTRDEFQDLIPQIHNAPSIYDALRILKTAHGIDFSTCHLPDKAFCLLLLALCETALANGITTVISNYEPHMRRVYQKAGTELDELGLSDGYGRYPVCCGAFEVWHRVLGAMRDELQVDEPLYRRPAFPPRIASAPALQFA